MDPSRTSSFSSRLYGIGKRTISRSLTIFLRKDAVSETHVARQTHRMAHTVSPSKTSQLTSDEKEQGRQMLLDFMKAHPRTTTSGATGDVRK